MRACALGLMLVACAAIAGCGGGGDVVGGQELYPTSTGSKWEYQVTTDDGTTTTSDKVVRKMTRPFEADLSIVEVTETLESGDVVADYMRSTSASLYDNIILRNTGSDQNGILLMKFPAMAGDEFEQYPPVSVPLYEGYGRITNWTERSRVIVAGREGVDTAVGSFINAVKFITVRTLDDGHGTVKQTYRDDSWYAAGVGLVKSVTGDIAAGTTVIRSLVAYSVDGRTAGTFSSSVAR